MILQTLLRFFRRLRRLRYKRVIVFGAIILILGTFGILYFEKGENDQFSNYKDAVWWLFVTMTTVGYGDKFPVTLGGRITAGVVMLMGIGLLGVLISVITENLLESKIKEDRGMKNVTVRRQVILCNWGTKARDIIDEFMMDSKMADTPIVLIDDMEHKPPIDQESVLFVSGDSTSEDTLKRAGISDAETVIVLSDEDVEVYSRDAKAILTVLTVKSLNPDVYTCVELLDAENTRHAERAKADEVIVTGEISRRLLARSALDHGISNVVSELVCGSYGNAFFKVDISPSMIGQSVEVLLLSLKKNYKSTLIAIERGKENITNPEPGEIIQEDDLLIVLTQKRPSLT